MRRTIVLAFALAACAAPPPAKPPPEAAAETERLQDLSLEHFLQRSTRLQRIAQSLRLAGRELCSRHLSPIVGVSVVESPVRIPGLDEAIARRFGRRGVYVVEAFPEMAAARAGLRPGDQVLSVDGKRVREASDLYRPATPEGASLRLAVRRGGQDLTLDVESVPGCKFPALLTIEERVNAWADGKSAYFGAALLRQLPRDVDLAYVVGHELAHNIHIVTGLESRTKRSRSYRVNAETRADYVGIYLCAMAGFRLHRDPELYRTLMTNVNSLGWGSWTHPVTHERTLRFAKTLEEIERKRRAGDPLVPSAQ